MLEAVEQGSTLVAVNNIPHLGLAVFALNSLSILIVGVNLNGKVVLSVDKLYKNREVLELLAVCSEYGLAFLFNILLFVR
jgi:hypothetical protein